MLPLDPFMKTGSAMQIVMSLFVILFGIFWTVTAYSVTANNDMMPFPIWIFGIFFVIIGILVLVSCIFGVKIPLISSRLNQDDKLPYQETPSYTNEFCPFCGSPVETGQTLFCRKCGKKIR